MSAVKRNHGTPLDQMLAGDIPTPPAPLPAGEKPKTFAQLLSGTPDVSSCPCGEIATVRTQVTVRPIPAAAGGGVRGCPRRSPPTTWGSARRVRSSSSTASGERRDER